jgi:hypothetical protein
LITRIACGDLQEKFPTELVHLGKMIESFQKDNMRRMGKA